MREVGQTPSSVYNLLPPTTAIIDYAIGLEKLSANGQVFVGTQMADNSNDMTPTD